MLQTGYYAKIKSHADQQNIVSISVSTPKWLYVAHRYQSLMPKYQLLQNFRNNRITEQQYVEQYNAMLYALDPQQVYDDLHKLTQKPIICCHCSTKHMCHRHLVADWLQSSLSIKIPEYKVGNLTRFDGRIVPSDPSVQLNLL